MPNPTDPVNLEGREDGARPRDFFWDTVTKYVVGSLVALAAIDSAIEYIRGSAISCRLPQGGSDDYINNYCSASIPASEYYPVFIAIHAILILIPHSLWANNYEGYFQFFFNECRLLVRDRDNTTGDYLWKNYLIVNHLERSFRLQKDLYTLYILKLLAQLAITLLGFLVGVFYFTEFNATFLCPTDFSNGTSGQSAPLWPLKEQVSCVYKSIRLFAILRLANLILLAILILSFCWSLASCASSYSSYLGTTRVSLFSFVSGISYNLYVPGNFALHRYNYHPFRVVAEKILRAIPYCGSGEYIKSNMDFLVVKLFRTDSGLGYIVRELQILAQIKYLNDDDQRFVNLHRAQQQSIDMKSGDLYLTEQRKTSSEDIVWTFPKTAGKKGIIDEGGEGDDSRSSRYQLNEDETLVIPQTLRGSIVGFASLLTQRRGALYITFGSPSFGIPCALARVFHKVYVFNFNPSFVKSSENEYYDIQRYSSEIQVNDYPGDILSSKYEKSNKFGMSLEQVEKKLDFIVVGPVEQQRHLSTLSLCLWKIDTHWSDKALLLTMTPNTLASKENAKLKVFQDFIPPSKYFKKPARNQRVRVSKSDNLQWPQNYCTNTTDGSLRLVDAITIRISKIDSKVKFQLYEVKKNEDKGMTGATSRSTGEGSIGRQTELDQPRAGGGGERTAINVA